MYEVSKLSYRVSYSLHSHPPVELGELAAAAAADAGACGWAATIKDQYVRNIVPKSSCTAVQAYSISFWQIRLTAFFISHNALQT